MNEKDIVHSVNRRMYFIRRYRWEYLEMLNQFYGMKFIREFAMPERMTVFNTMEVYARIWVATHKQLPAFLSVNEYEDTVPPGIKVNYRKPVVDRLFFDFDNNDLHETYEEVKNFVWHYIGEHNAYVVFSGSKGFHVYLLFSRPRRMTPEEYTDLWWNYASGFEHVDTQCCDVVRVSRIPYTFHEKTGLQAVMVNPNDTVDSILWRAENYVYPSPPVFSLWRRC